MTTTDPFTEAARAEAERRWSRDQADGRPLPAYARMNRRIGFDLGAQWAAAQEPTDAVSIARKNLGDDAVDRLAAHFGVAQEPTDTEVEAACLGFYNDPNSLTDWTKLARIQPDLADKYRAGMRRALSAARAARRDEEKR